jgi:hypothetical protein
MENMQHMFGESQFNGDISNWNVINVKNMDYMFYDSNFNGDLNTWKPYKAEVNILFVNNKPYWSEYLNLNERKKAIDHYVEKLQLVEKLEKILEGSTIGKRVKL